MIGAALLLAAVLASGPAAADDSALAQLGAMAGQSVAPAARQERELRASKQARGEQVQLDAAKPALLDGPDAARKKCELLSRRAAARGANTLIVAFEGLISFDSAGATAADQYQKDVAAGDPTAARPVPVMGFVLHQLLVPLIEKYGDKFEFLVFRHLSQPGVGENFVPAACAEAWARGAAPGPRHLIVVGHSMGGLAASALAKTLEAPGIPVDLLVTIDPWPAPVARGANVRRWENYTQLVPDPGFGLPASGADLNKILLSADHLSIPGNPAVVGSVDRQLGAMIAGTSLASGPAPRPAAASSPFGAYRLGCFLEGTDNACHAGDGGCVCR